MHFSSFKIVAAIGLLASSINALSFTTSTRPSILTNRFVNVNFPQTPSATSTIPTIPVCLTPVGGITVCVPCLRTTPTQSPNNDHLQKRQNQLDSPKLDLAAASSTGPATSTLSASTRGGLPSTTSIVPTTSTSHMGSTDTSPTTQVCSTRLGPTGPNTDSIPSCIASPIVTIFTLTVLAPPVTVTVLASPVTVTELACPEENQSQPNIFERDLAGTTSTVAPSSTDELYPRLGPIESAIESVVATVETILPSIFTS